MKGRQTAIQKFDRITSCNRTKAKYDHIKHQASSSQQPKHSPFILHSCKITTPSFIKSDRKNVSHYIVQATKLETNLSKHALAKMQCYNSPILTSSTFNKYYFQQPSQSSLLDKLSESLHSLVTGDDRCASLMMPGISYCV